MKNAPGKNVAQKTQWKHEENGQEEKRQHGPSSAQPLRCRQRSSAARDIPPPGRDQRAADRVILR